MLHAAVRRSCLKRAYSPSDATGSTSASSGRAHRRSPPAVRFDRRLEIIDVVVDASDDDIDSCVDIGDVFSEPVVIPESDIIPDDPGDALMVPDARADDLVILGDQGDDLTEIGKKTKTMKITKSGIPVWKSATRYKKPWYDRSSVADGVYEDITDSSDNDNGDDMNFGDVLVIDSPDVGKFKKLAAHLGGLAIDVYHYQSMFGRITDAAPFGENIWSGMSAVYSSNAGYPYMAKIWAEVPWIGYFVSPELFSKSTTASAVSASAPSRAWTTANAYPAIFILTAAQHKYVEDCVLGARPTSSPSDMDFFDNIELNGKTRKVDGDPWSIAGKTEIEFDARTFEGVYMVCLKILIAGCRPWNIHASRMRLYKPLSRL